VKFLVMGSAPYMRDWTRKHLGWFWEEGYCISAINNSWCLCPYDFTWHRSRDFFEAGTRIPTKKQILGVTTIVHKTRNKHGHLYLRYKKNQRGSMLFSTIYWILQTKPQATDIVVIGSDFVYGDVLSFYSRDRTSKARNDPFLRYSKKEIIQELSHTMKIAEEKSVSLWNASKETESFLPYERFLDYV